MGPRPYFRIIILIALFSAVSAYVYSYAPKPPQMKPTPLSEAFAVVDGWQTMADQHLEPFIIAELKLDDHLFRTYRKGGNALSLYIGYYLSESKVGAAHDPLVCFPGQGWVLGGKSRETLVVDDATGKRISYASMVAEKGTQRELVLYWFQSNQFTSSSTLMQKLKLLQSRFQGERGENAFVRVSASLEDKPVHQVREEILDFMRAFYPQFLDFIRQEA